MRKRFGSGIYAGHSLLNTATKTFITWVHDLKQISLYKLIKKGCKTVSSPVMLSESCGALLQHY